MAEQTGGNANAAPVLRKPLPPYFVNLPVDFLLIGGASLATYLLMALLHDGSRTVAIYTIAGYLVWVVNWPHFSATSYRLYATREHVRQYPVTASITPLLVAAGVLGSFASPALVAPYFIKLFLIWSPYHFSGQTMGISLLYARRHGYAVSPLQRLALSGFVYATFLIGVVRSEGPNGGGEYYGIRYPSFGLPPIVTSSVEWGLAALGVAFAAFVIGKAVRDRRMPPLLFLLPAITQFVWFVPGAGMASYNEFVPLFHSLQYLLIAWAMQLRERSDRSGVAPNGAYVGAESVRWYLINVAGGAALFSLLPFVASSVGVTTALASAVIISGVQIHHFFVDGVIWKLRSSSVVSPLLVNVPEMVRQAAGTPPRRVVAA